MSAAASLQLFKRFDHLITAPDATRQTRTSSTSFTVDDHAVTWQLGI